MPASAILVFVLCQAPGAIPKGALRKPGRGLLPHIGFVFRVAGQHAASAVQLEQHGVFWQVLPHLEFKLVEPVQTHAGEDEQSAVVHFFEHGHTKVEHLLEGGVLHSELANGEVPLVLDIIEPSGVSRV